MDGRPPKWTGFDFVGPIAELISCDTTTEAVKRAAAPAMPKRQNGPKSHGGDDVSRAHAHIHQHWHTHTCTHTYTHTHAYITIRVFVHTGM